MIRASTFAVLGAALALGGCANMSGLDSSNTFSCKAAPGVTCQSISGVHANASAGALPFQRNGEANANANKPEGTQTSAGNGETQNNTTDSQDEKKPAYGSTPVGDGKASPRDMNAASSGMPVRQPPLVLRVWMAPYEDEGGDLHDQAYFYTMVHSGRWMIEANRSSIANQYRPIYPLNRQTQRDDKAPGAESEKGGPLVQKGNYGALVDKPDVR